MYLWFRPWGWVYRPVSIAGWLIVLFTFAACVWVFIVLDRHSHSASDTLENWFVYAALFLFIAGWIASHTSGAPSQ